MLTYMFYYYFAINIKVQSKTLRNYFCINSINIFILVVGNSTFVVVLNNTFCKIICYCYDIPIYIYVCSCEYNMGSNSIVKLSQMFNLKL